MNIQWLGTASLGMLPIFCMAAGLEKSDQSIHAFLEGGNYLELSYAQLHANVSGQVSHQEELQKIGVQDFSTGALIQPYSMLNAAIKIQYHPKLSLAFIYDQPYAANLKYDYSPHTTLGKQSLESAQFDVNSHNLSSIFGYQPTPNWNIYSGFAIQDFRGYLNLNGLSYSVMSGYEAQFKPDTALGWIAGLSYQRPEYALQAAITYRSEIKHQSHINESIQGQTLLYTPEQSTTIKTPQSINIDFRSALNTNNLLYSSLRWVNWKNFEIQPTQFDAILNTVVEQYPDLVQHFNLIDYQDDQWSAKLGIAHRFTEQWVMSTDASWDSGTGNPAGTLNPSDGYYAFALGVMYYPRPKSFIATGVKYFKLQKADVMNQSTLITGNQNTNLNTVNNNDAIAYGLRIGHFF